MTKFDEIERDNQSVIEENDSYNQHRLTQMQVTVKDKIEVIKEIIRNYNEGNEKP